MNLFPPIGLYQPFHIGDNVIIEPIAATFADTLNTNIYVISKYPSMFQHHPTVIGLSLNDTHPTNMRTIDMTDSIASNERNDGVLVVYSDKLERMYKASGIPNTWRTPKLYLSPDEIDKARDFKKMFNGKLIGVVPRSRHVVKDYPHINSVASALARSSHNDIFAIIMPGTIGLDTHNTRFYTIQPANIRELMIYLSAMDIVVGCDTGPLHIAGALGVKIVVVGMSYWKELYKPYAEVSYISSSTNFLSLISPRKVVKSLRKLSKTIPERNKLAVVLLEGLGGTVTLSDHVKKLYDKFRIKPTVVVRKHIELFANNPYIENRITVGMIPYDDAIKQVCSQYKTVIGIKAGIGRWYNGKSLGVKQDFSAWEDIWNCLPLDTQKLEKHGLNWVQLVNKSLGLSYFDIEVDVFNYEEVLLDLPDEYVVVSNGVDTWHKGLKQTKSWEHSYWTKLTKMLDISVLQLGTEFDEQISGAVDLRGQTNVPQMLTILRDATAIVCTEGGLMHLSYAVKNKNTFVLRGPTRGCFYSYPDQIYIDSYVCSPCYWQQGDWYRRCIGGCNTACMKTITPERVMAVMERRMDVSLVKDAQSTQIELVCSMAEFEDSLSGNRMPGVV